VPALPPGTTTIVWNWHWGCSDVTPQPLDVGGVTICTSCNIAISLRIASPGDSGSIAQTIATQAATTVAQVSAEVQKAAQVPQTPLPPAAAAVGPPAPAAAPSPPTAPVLQMRIDVAPSGPIESSFGDDEAPRHGGEALLATRRGDPRGQPVIGNVIGALTPPWQSRSPRREPLDLTSLRAVSRADTQRHATGEVASEPTRSAPRSPSPPGPAPEFPLPAVLALSPVGLQHPASSALVAFAIGGVAVVMQLFFIYLAPLGRLVRARAGVAEPHPPG
jgi:hypothetical protein